MTWTAFTRASLKDAVLSGVNLESTEALRATGTGFLETAPIEAVFLQSIVSWNALTPPNSGLRLEVRVRFGTRWTAYLRLADWTDDPSQNTSFDTFCSDFSLETDTIICRTPADALQIRVTLRGAVVLTGLAATFDTPPSPTPPSRTAWGLELAVPLRSQMIYPDGGRVWCSPTSTTMLLEYWSGKLGRELAQTVPEAAQAVWDVAYGAGNWAFNMAYASRTGLQAYIAHLDSLYAAAEFLARGIPIALSIGWTEGELSGAPVGHSQGHLIVLRGFTVTGDPIVNDPAHPTDAAVRVVYNRAELENAWQKHSGGIVYIVQPNPYTS